MLAQVVESVEITVRFMIIYSNQGDLIMNLIRVAGLAFVAFYFSLLSVGAVQADEIFYSVKGIKQGPFNAETTQKGREGTAPVRMFQYGIVSPRDAATGQATGKRQHKSVVITKLWGASSPQLFQALVSNELLSEVIIDFYETSPRLIPKLGHSIKLTNASVVEISYRTEETRLRQVETVSFNFQKIEYMDGARNVTAADDWNIPIN